MQPKLFVTFWDEISTSNLYGQQSHFSYLKMWASGSASRLFLAWLKTIGLTNLLVVQRPQGRRTGSDMTDELNRASAEPETTKPEETVPVGADVVTVVEDNAVENSAPGKVTVESPPDWLKPMEEDEDDGGDGGEGVKSSEWITRKTNNDVYVLIPDMCLHLVGYIIVCVRDITILCHNIHYHNTKMQL